MSPVVGYLHCHHRLRGALGAGVGSWAHSAPHICLFKHLWHSLVHPYVALLPPSPRGAGCPGAGRVCGAAGRRRALCQKVPAERRPDAAEAAVGDAGDAALRVPATALGPGGVAAYNQFEHSGGGACTVAEEAPTPIGSRAHPCLCWLPALSSCVSARADLITSQSCGVPSADVVPDRQEEDAHGQRVVAKRALRRFLVIVLRVYLHPQAHCEERKP